MLKIYTDLKIKKLKSDTTLECGLEEAMRKEVCKSHSFLGGSYDSCTLIRAVERESSEQPLFSCGRSAHTVLPHRHCLLALCLLHLIVAATLHVV